MGKKIRRVLKIRYTTVAIERGEFTQLSVEARFIEIWLHDRVNANDSNSFASNVVILVTKEYIVMSIHLLRMTLM